MSERHTPDEETVRWQYVVKRMHDGATRTHAEREYSRWLAAHDARVRRDAAREALDGLADVHRRHASESDQAAASDVHSIVASQALHYRDTHYPEETPCTCDSAPPEIGGAQHRAGCGEEPS